MDESLVQKICTTYGDGTPSSVASLSAVVSAAEAGSKAAIDGAPEGAFYFDGKAADFAVVDSDGDVFLKGAFADSIKYIQKSRRGRIGVYWNHSFFFSTPIGAIYDFKESPSGLMVSGFIDPGVKNADDVIRGIKMGALTDMSVTVRIDKYSIRNEQDDRGRYVREIEKADLREISIVWYGAQVGARLNAAAKAAADADAGLQSAARDVGLVKIFKDAVKSGKEEQQ